MVPEVIDSLMRLQMEVIQNLINGISLYPQDVPVLAFNLPITPLFESVQNAVLKSCLELNSGVMIWVVLFLDVLPEILRH